MQEQKKTLEIPVIIQSPPQVEHQEIYRNNNFQEAQKIIDDPKSMNPETLGNQRILLLSNLFSKRTN